MTATKLRFTIWRSWRESIADGRHPDGRRPTQTYAQPVVLLDRRDAETTHRRLTRGRWVQATMHAPAVSAIHVDKLEQAAGKQGLWTVVSTWELADAVDLDSTATPPTRPPPLFDTPPEGTVRDTIADRQTTEDHEQVDVLLEELADKLDDPQLTARAMETAQQLLDTGVPRAARAYVTSMLTDPSRLATPTPERSAA